MRKRILLLMFPFLLLSVGAFAQVIDKPAATVNLTTPVYISVSQLNQRMDQIDAIRKLKGIPIPPDNKMQVLDAMISETLISQAAAKANVTVSQSELDDTVAKQQKAIENQIGPLTTDQYHQVIQQQTGLTWDKYLKQLKTQLVEQKYIMQEKGSLINGVPAPTKQQIEERYSQIATRLTNPEIIRFSQIFIDTRNLTEAERKKAKSLADSIYHKYENGEATFSQLVQQYTNDQHSRYSGGDFGYLARDDARAQQILGQSFMNDIFSMKVGQVSGVLQSKIGYHIVKITEHYPPKLLTLDDPISPANPMTVREYIRESILQEEKTRVFDQAVKEVVAQLKQQADVTIYKKNIE